MKAGESHQIVPLGAYTLQQYTGPYRRQEIPTELGHALEFKGGLPRKFTGGACVGTRGT